MLGRSLILFRSYEIRLTGLTVPYLRYFSKFKDLIADGRLEEAVQQIEGRRSPSFPATYVTVLRGTYSNLTLAKRAQKAVLSSGVKMDQMLASVLASSMAKTADSSGAFELFKKLRKDQIELNSHIFAALLTALTSNPTDVSAKANLKQVLNSFRTLKGSVTLSKHLGAALLKAHNFVGDVDTALKLVEEMEAKHLEMDGFVYTTALASCADRGALETGRRLYAKAAKFQPVDRVLESAYLNLLIKCQQWEEATVLFKNMHKHLNDWNIMISGFAAARKVDEVMRMFEDMKNAGLQPNELTVTSILLALSHVGQVRRAREILEFASSLGLVNDFHYVTVLDAMGRAGQFEQARDFFYSLPIRSIVAYMAFLGACRTYGQIELAEALFDEMLKLPDSVVGDKQNLTAAYVLMANLYADHQRNEDSARLYQEMKRRGLAKEPGRSWVEIDSAIHGFSANEIEHPEIAQVREHWEKLKNRMMNKGYRPDIKWALKPGNEEDKIKQVCGHSEKLALSYADLKVAPGKPLHIVKNLRVCGDCHEATKFLSVVLGREIHCRDASVYHHFVNGRCSCNDYF